MDNEPRNEPRAMPASVFEGHVPEPPPPPQWMAQLDERTNKHIAFARQYAAQFAHGAPGHLDLMTIATLAKLLDERELSD